MRNKIAAVLMAGVIMCTGVANAGAAEAAPKKNCEDKLTPVARVNSSDSGKRIYAMGRTKRPNGRNEHGSVKVGIEVWSPNPKVKGRGGWTPLGKKDYDLHTSVAIAVAEAPLLAGTQTYRSVGTFVCRTKEKVFVSERASKPVTFLRNNTPFYGVDINKPNEWGTGHGGWNGKGDGGAWGKKFQGWGNGS